MAKGHLSPIELAVLGFVDRDGPITGYAVMREFAGNPAACFSGSSGTIYPLVAKLEKLGLLERQSHATGSRRAFAITAAGSEAVARWLAEPLAESELAASLDLVRIRAFFLKRLSPEARLELMDRTLRATLEIQNRAEDAVDAALDAFSKLAAEGYLYEIRARVQWILHAKDALLELD